MVTMIYNHFVIVMAPVASRSRCVEERKAKMADEIDLIIILKQLSIYYFYNNLHFVIFICFS